MNSDIREFWNTKEKRYKTAIAIGVGLLILGFIITQIVKLTWANANPLFAYAYVEDSNASEVFPEVAVCPGFSENGTLGAITSVTCVFQSYGQALQKVSVTPSVSYTIEGIVHNCFKINQEMSIVSRNLTDVIRCTAKSNVNVLSAFYDENTGAPSYWFSWTILPLYHDTAIGLVKWFYNGEEVGYKVQTVQEEYRFGPNILPEGVQFTIQWDFLGQGRYGIIYTYDFWTGVGVIGGYSFLMIQVFKFFMWIGHTCLKVRDEGYREPSLEPTNYQSL